MTPFTLHRRHSKGPFSLIRAMSFSINAVNQEGERLLAELPEIIKGHNYSYKFNEQMRFHLDHIMEQFKHRKPLFEENIICDIRSFIASFMQEYFGNAFVTGKTLKKSYSKIPEVSLVDGMKMFAETMMNQQMSMEALSAHFNLSGRHLNRVFRKHTGISINNYTLRRKAELASHFLSTSNMKVYEIATALGFKSDTYFSIFFKISFVS
jgi:AraC-like DNA-binding protein